MWTSLNYVWIGINVEPCKYGNKPLVLCEVISSATKRS